jgi:hypothetical protein
MQNERMTKEEIQTWCLHKLGAPFTKVEIGQENLDYCVEEACRWFSAKKGYKETITVAVGGGVALYDLPDQVDTVLDCTFSSSTLDYSYLVDPMSLIGGQIPTAMFGYGGSGNMGGMGGGDSGGFLSSYAQFTQYLGMAKRILNAESDWVQVNRQLLVLPPPRQSGLIVMEYKTHAFTVEKLNERDHDLVKRKVLCLVKEFVGRVRSKFGNYPTAQGQEAVDGGALLQESEKEFQLLEEEIFNSGFPMGILVG